MDAQVGHVVILLHCSYAFMGENNPRIRVPLSDSDPSYSGIILEILH